MHGPLFGVFCLCNEIFDEIDWGAKMLCQLRIAPTGHSPTFFPSRIFLNSI